MSEEVKEFVFASEKEYKDALKKAPNPKWIESRSLGGNKSSRYISIHVLQAIADKLFKEWSVISEDYDVIENEIVAKVKIQFTPSYPGADIQFMTGVGAKPIQCRSGSSFPTGKITNALEYNAPAARASAISNAFNTIGNLFGRNLNRKSADNYSIK